MIDPLWPSLFRQDGWILVLFLFCMFMDLDSVLVPKHAKKELGHYSDILTSHKVNTIYLDFTAHVLNSVLETYVAI